MMTQCLRLTLKQGQSKRSKILMNLLEKLLMKWDEKDKDYSIHHLNLQKNRHKFQNNRNLQSMNEKFTWWELCYLLWSLLYVSWLLCYFKSPVLYLESVFNLEDTSFKHLQQLFSLSKHLQLLPFNTWIMNQFSMDGKDS